MHSPLGHGRQVAEIGSPPDDGARGTGSWSWEQRRARGLECLGHKSQPLLGDLPFAGGGRRQTHELVDQGEAGSEIASDQWHLAQ